MSLRLPDDKALEALLKGSHVRVAGDGRATLQSGASTSVASLSGSASATPALPKPKRARMNKLETEWASILEARKQDGEILWYGFEAISLRLAKGARFKPDFAVIDKDGNLMFDETKGFWREAAKVRMRVASELYPFWKFYAIHKIRKRDGGGWDIEAF